MAGWLQDAILSYQDFVHREEIAKVTANATTKIGKIQWEQMRNDRAMYASHWSVYWEWLQHLIEFIIFILVLIACGWLYKKAHQMRGTKVQGKINKHKSGVRQTQNGATVSKPSAQRVATAQPGQSYGININPALDDAAAQMAYYEETNGKDAKVALDLLKQTTEFEEGVAGMTKRRIDARLNLDDSVTRAELRDQDKNIQRLRTDLEEEKLRLELDSTRAKRKAVQAVSQASLRGQNPASLEGMGLGPHVGEDEIKREAHRIAVRVSEAHKAGEDEKKVVEAHLRKLSEKYPRNFIEEICDYYHENLRNL